jgi:serine/threonine protein kinase
MSKLQQKFHAGIKIGDNLVFENGSYRIISQLGQGGMGAVWYAHNVKINRYVVIKEFFNSIYKDAIIGENVVELFWMKEAKITEVQSKAPVPTMEFMGKLKLSKKELFFLERDEFYLFLEHIDGKPLDGWYMEHYHDMSKLTLTELKDIIENIIIPIVKHMAFVHGRNIVHRDLTTGNIMIETHFKTGKSISKVIDWGIAEIVDPWLRYNPRKPYCSDATPKTREITNRGAPIEILKGYQPVMATDVYMLGHILFYIFSGGNYRPYADDPEDYILTPSDYNLKLPPEFDQLVEKMTQYEPADRIQKMSDVLVELEKLLMIENSENEE